VGLNAFDAINHQPIYRADPVAAVVSKRLFNGETGTTNLEFTELIFPQVRANDAGARNRSGDTASQPTAKQRAYFEGN